MTDRELLELASKAAGIDIIHHLQNERDGIGCGDKGLWTSDSGSCWNPLTNDGDALRLAVACQLGISIVGGRAGLVECVSFKECHCFVSSREFADDGDLCAATRRAIVRAAAEIGAQM